MTDKNNVEKKIFELHARVCKTLSHPKRLEIIVAYDALRKLLKEQLETNGKLLEKF